MRWLAASWLSRVERGDCATLAPPVAIIRLQNAPADRCATPPSSSPAPPVSSVAIWWRGSSGTARACTPPRAMRRRRGEAVATRPCQTPPGTSSTSATPAPSTRWSPRVRPDVVFHLASLVKGSRDRALVLPALEANLDSDRATARRRRHPRLPPLRPDRLARGAADRRPAAAPASPYAAAKTAATAYCRMYAELYSVSGRDRARVHGLRPRRRRTTRSSSPT